MTLRFRVRAPNGSQQVLHSISNSITIENLQQLIINTFNLSTTTSCIQIKYIYPPPQIISNNINATLKSLNLQNGNLIITIINPSSSKTNTNNNNTNNTPSISETKTEPKPKATKTETKKICNLKNGKVIKKEIAADNSCLFNAVSYVCDNGRIDRTSELRQLIASIVLSNPNRYSNALLGKSNEEYVEYILMKDTWGGYIELQILSEIYEIQINAIDVVTLQVHKFGEGEHYAHCVYVIYNGIHYDSLVLQDGNSMQYKFNNDDMDIYSMAMSIAIKMNAKKEFTDVYNFTLQCSVCLEKIKGQDEASKHATVTGHCQFQEYHPK